MKKKFYSFWGVSQLLVGAMTIGLVSCEKSSELLYDFSETSESSIQSRAISVADSVSLFSNIDVWFWRTSMKKVSVSTIMRQLIWNIYTTQLPNSVFHFLQMKEMRVCWKYMVLVHGLLI